ncbi:hypothetical protein CYMTET_4590 [Cymbomonas tetramitiformis]|uniref:Uncharacterized protein n=1 Tax=Cymbomonas tetramitiformis TaxID=36881 RepID=A0AAE0LJY7_9CHLO|nr:hypothetical protein CYMTET_4590 [Cymbomonas tetramitiformis]
MLNYVPEAPVNPFPARPATLTTRMPQLYDLHGNKTYDALSKKSNSSMRWTMLELRAQLEQEPGSSQHGGNDALRAKLQFVENKVYQAADGVVADEELQQWLNDFDKSRGKALLNSAAKNAANADARFGRDQRKHRWWDKRKNDEEKDRKPSEKGGKGRGAKPSADG